MFCENSKPKLFSESKKDPPLPRKSADFRGFYFPKIIGKSLKIWLP